MSLKSLVLPMKQISLQEPKLLEMSVLFLIIIIFFFEHIPPLIHETRKMRLHVAQGGKTKKNSLIPLLL